MTARRRESTRRKRPDPLTAKNLSPREALRVARTEIARLQKALQDIANDDTSDAESLRDAARDAGGEPWLPFQMEAEELRKGIETLIEDEGQLIRDLVPFYADESAVKAEDLLDLLDRVDARDSLTFLEMRRGTDRRVSELKGKASAEYARRRSGF